MADNSSKTRKIIDDLTRKINELMAEAEISKEDVKKEILKKVEELKKARDEVNEEFRKIRDENKETFDEIEQTTRKIARGFKAAYKGFLDSWAQDDQKTPEDK